MYGDRCRINVRDFLVEVHAAYHFESLGERRNITDAVPYVSKANPRTMMQI